MAEPVSYEQIIRELAVKRGLKPWEIAMSQETAAPTPAAPAAAAAAPMGSVADQPMAEAQKRAKLMGLLGQMDYANPETQMAQQGQAPGNGLIQLLMGLMR